MNYKVHDRNPREGVCTQKNDRLCCGQTRDREHELFFVDRQIVVWIFLETDKFDKEAVLSLFLLSKGQSPKYG